MSRRPPYRSAKSPAGRDVGGARDHRFSTEEDEAASQPRRRPQRQWQVPRHGGNGPNRRNNFNLADPDVLLVDLLRKGDRLDIGNVQTHRTALCEILSNEENRSVIPQVTVPLVRKIGNDYAAYRQLILEMMYKAETLLYDNAVSGLFRNVLEVEPYKELKDRPLLRRMEVFARKAALAEAPTAQKNLLAVVREKLQLAAPLRHEFTRQIDPNGVYPDALNGPSEKKRDLPEMEDMSSDNQLENLPKVMLGAPIPDEKCSAHLRVQYELTRSDAFYALCQDIAAVREAARARAHHQGFSTEDWRTTLRKKGGRSVRPYCNISCNGPALDTQHGLFYVFHVPKSEKNVREKSFMTGNMVMCSAWNFDPSKPVYVGVVRQVRNPKAKGMVSVVETRLFGVQFFLEVTDFTKGVNFAEVWRAPGMTWTFLESIVFFKPYHAALIRMREMRDSIPLQSSILRGDTGEPPAYVFTQRDLVVRDCVEMVDGAEDSFDVLDEEAWRLHCVNWTLERETAAQQHELSDRCHVLDETQREALRHIFSHQLAIVQGTPGTGKTFVGTKFVQILLNNTLEMARGPIVCMALTNHAVDAFLEDILKMAGHKLRQEGDVVRLGGGTRKEELKRYQFRSCGPSFEARELCDEVQAILKSSRNCNPMFKRFQGFANIGEEVKKSLRKSICDRFRFNPSKAQQLAFLAQSTRNLYKERMERTRQPDDSKPTMEWLQMAYNRADACLNSHHKEDQKWGIEMTEAIYELEQKSQEISGRSDYWIEAWIVAHSLAELDRWTDREACDMWVSPPTNGCKIGYLQLSPELLLGVLGPSNPQGPLPRGLSAETENMIAAEHRLEVHRPPESSGPTEPEADDLKAVMVRLDQAEAARRLEAVGEEEEVETNFTPVYNKERLAELKNFVESYVDHLSFSELKSVPLSRRMLLHCVAESVYQQEKISEAAEMAENTYADLILRESYKSVIQRNGEKLSTAKLIVGTTDSVMSHLEALHLARPRVLVVEEAAEVLECHILASIPVGLQHLVLIGDHKQLSPKVNEYSLEIQKGLGVSLQERLILCGAPFVTLTTQRRMHPEISRFVHPYYQRNVDPGDQPVQIVDHPRTRHIMEPSCVGDVRRTLRTFFVDYTAERGLREEKQDPVVESPYNTFECDVASAIARHLHRYHPDQTIVVLVPYKGQLFKMMASLKDMSKTVLCRTVDDFQGEEADFIVLSLTRTERAGFLKRENRACVALSRAKMGCYVVGCSAILHDANSILQHFFDLMSREGKVGLSFPGFCPMHQCAFPFASMKELEENSCKAPCTAILRDCGHECGLQCHTSLHEGVKCMKPCDRVGAACTPARHCRHRCRKRCHEKCMPCEEPVEYTCPQCGDTFTVKCFQTINPSQYIACQKRIQVPPADSPCGHEMQVRCCDRRKLGTDPEGLCKRYCEEKCGQHMPCGHVCPRKCHFGEDSDHTDQRKRCRAVKVAVNPSCGHRCEVKCSVPDDFPKCTERCGKTNGATGCECVLECAHEGSCSCGNPHSMRCPKGHTYEVACEASEKSKCPKACGVKLACEHDCPGTCGTCSDMQLVSGVHSLMSHQKCSKRCKKPLPCGHLCQDGCGYPCGECRMPCSFHCGHGAQCNKSHTCTECPARRCQEPCQWNCPHYQCSLLCSEPCQRQKCDERCDKLLPCGHRCFGLCGERCPPLCPDCYVSAGETQAQQREIAARVFCDGVYLLDEEERETYCRGEAQLEGCQPVELRVVELACCQGLTLVGFLDRSLESWYADTAGEEGNRKLGVPRCPCCQQPLMPETYRRQGKMVKECLQRLGKLYEHQRKQRQLVEENNKAALQHVWDAICTDEEMKEPLKRELQKHYAAHRSDNNRAVHAHIQKILGKTLHARNPIFRDIVQWCLQVDLRSPSISKIVSGLLFYLDGSFNGVVPPKCATYQLRFQEYAKWLISRPQVEQSAMEVFSCIMEWLYCLCKVHRNGVPLESNLVEEAHVTLFPQKLPEPSTNIAAAVNLANIENLLKDVGRPAVQKLNTAALLQEITKALQEKDVNIRPGSWYQCPNGHLYVIADCGGAIQQGVCPDCKAVVGGQLYVLVRGNRTAAHLMQPKVSAGSPA